MNDVDYELEVLLDLDGFEYRFEGDYRVKLAAQRIETSPGRPAGVKSA